MTRPAVLMLRALGLGDFLTGVPVYRALHAAYPEHETVLAAPAWLRPLADLCGAIDRVLPTGELRPIGWSGPPPDVAVDLHGNGPASHRLVAATRARTQMMYASVSAPCVRGPRWRDDEHEIARWCRLVSWWGVRADPSALGLAPPVTAPRVTGAAIVHPGAASGSRRWPAARYAAVAAELAAGGIPVVITGTVRERPLARAIAADAGLAAESVLAGELGLAELAAVTSQARVVVSGDTGVAHLGFAYHRPSVTLYGPVSPRLWGPPVHPRHVVLWHGSGGRPGDPHGAVPDPRLLAITVPEVKVALAFALDHRAVAQPT